MPATVTPQPGRGHDASPPPPTERLAGWLFLFAGLALLVSVILIPPADDLTELRHERDLLAAEERDAVTELATYAAFLDALEERDPDLVRRLALSHLNLIPEDTEAVAMIGDGTDASIENWIQAALPDPEGVPPPALAPTFLRQISTGPMRLWTMLVGAVLVFMGLLPGTNHPSRVGTLAQFRRIPHPV